ncbi:MAG: site-2 protease family protein [Alphaproteobacteria bacterium]|nr:site-2 protease family protein [Alphaproteobacteria bacterium]
MSDLIQTVVFHIFPLFFAIVFHEISHGLAAYALGDDTAKKMGRFKIYTHFDLWGSFLIPLGLYLMHSPFLIGYAKPVPVDPRNFKDPITDMALVAIAGPLYNLLMAIICAFGLQSTGGFLQALLFSFTITNLALFFFNLIPIPPLDGSRILAAILPRQFLETFYRIEPYGFFIIIGLELLSEPLSNLIGYRVGLFYTFVQLPIQSTLEMLLS